MKRTLNILALVIAVAVWPVWIATSRAQQPAKPRPESLSFNRLDTTKYWQQTPWHPEPLWLTLAPNGKAVLTITPDGRFVLGPGATADSAARAIVALAEEYVAWKRCR